MIESLESYMSDLSLNDFRKFVEMIDLYNVVWYSSAVF